MLPSRAPTPGGSERFILHLDIRYSKHDHRQDIEERTSSQFKSNVIEILSELTAKK